jgi:hypothetical protein
LVGFAGVALAVILLAVWAARAHRHEAEYTLEGDEQGPSTDLTADLKLMWQTEPLRGTPDPSHGKNPRASTDAATKAASRVFNTVNLVGLTREEVVAKLGDPKTSSDSIYNFPFHPSPKGVMVYRFDTGSYGWQFNLHFDATGKVSKVERLWIQ